MVKIKKHLIYLSHFATGQLLLQLLNILNGFFLLRWLSVTEQAKFSVAFSIQSLILSLSDLGFTGSILALVGNRIDDKKVVGAYIHSAKKMRNYLFAISCFITMCFLPIIIKKQSWSYLDLAIIMTPVLLAVFWQADCSLYDSTLVMHKKIKELYKPQVALAGLRFLLNYIFYFVNIIGAFPILIINALILLINGKAFKRKALPYIQTTTKGENEIAYKEMLYYLKPLFPSLIFNAVYGQVQIFLISFFGKTSSIAEVAALGKLSQLFLFLSSLNGIIIAPLIARADKKDLMKKYFAVLGLSILISFIIFLTSCFLPNWYMFLLGPKYYHLKSMLGIMIINACLAYIIGTVWTMSSARKWVFWWGTGTYIGTIICCQIGGVLFLNLSTTYGVLQLSLFTSLGVLMVHFFIAIVGFYKEKRNIEFSL